MVGPEPILLIGPDIPDVRRLAGALDATVLLMPDEAARSDWSWVADLEEWRDEAGREPARARIAVACWQAYLVAGNAASLDAAGWQSRAEQPLGRWAAALDVAARVCADAGSIVAVVDGPTVLECAGWAPETAVAEGVRALARSLALSEGGRGVRVNAVSSPARLPLGRPADPAPPLPTFPGRLEREVAGAVRLLLGPDASGITGSLIHADAGRAWR